MKNTWIIGIIALAIVALLIFLGRGSGPGETPPESAKPTQPASQPEQSQLIEITLLPQNDLGQTGYVFLEEIGGPDGKVDVIVKLESSIANVVQPAHLHLGSCDELGPIEFPLDSVTEGFSQTTLEVSVNELQALFPLVVNLHKSEDELEVSTACGALVLE